VIKISRTTLVGRKERILEQFFGVSPTRDKCCGHRLAATEKFEEQLKAVVRYLFARLSWAGTGSPSHVVGGAF
jgi:hypothetical protein